jgi:hypothetical protein
MANPLFLVLCSTAWILALAGADGSVITDPELDYVTSKTFANGYLPTTDEVNRMDLKLTKRGPAVAFLTFRTWAIEAGMYGQPTVR